MPTDKKMEALDQMSHQILPRSSNLIASDHILTKYLNFGQLPTTGNKDKSI